MLELKLIKGPGITGGESFELPQGKSITIGRAEECQIRLPSAGISKKHCVITPLSGSRVEIEDLGSANGTYVNGLLIKRHIMQPGDTLGIHNFVLQLSRKIPRAQSRPQSSNDDVIMGADLGSQASMESIQAEATRKNQGLAQKIEEFLDKNIYPVADRLSTSVDMRVLLFLFLAVWTLTISSLALSPFKDKANTQARNESIEVARLYARQLARLNQDAVIEQRYKDLVADIDSRKGQTPGIMSSMIIDVVNAQMLAPIEKLGQPLPENLYVQTAKTKDNEYIGINDSEGLAYVAHPIKIGTAQGNKTVAMALVEYSYVDGQFSFTNLLDQIVSSLLYALAISGVFIVFAYRWIEGSLNRLASATEKALRSRESAVSLDVQWPALKNLAQEISFALSRASEKGENLMGSGLDSADWAIACTNNTRQAAAAFNSQLTVIAWNPKMATLIGIQESMALGSEISQASRDIAFETAVRDLANEAQMLPWKSVSKSMEFSGRPYRLSMINGTGALLLQIESEEG